MKRYILTLIFALIVAVGLTQLLPPAKTAAADLTAANSEAFEFSLYYWQDMAHIVAQTADGQTITFYDGNGVNDYIGGLNSKSFLGAYYAGSCTIGGNTGASTIDANPSDLSAANQPVVQWKFVPANTQSCQAYAPPPVNGNGLGPITIVNSSSYGSNKTEFTFNSGSDEIDLVDNSDTPYTEKSATYPNIYTQGTGQCAPEIVVDSSGNATLWPLGINGGGGQKVTDTSTDAVGCYVDLNQLDSVTSVIAAKDANGENKTTGSIPITVSGLHSVKVNPDGSVTCADGSSATSIAQCVTSNGGATGSEPSCEGSAAGGPLSWIICPVVTLIQNTEQSIETLINDLLKTQPIDFGAISNNTASTNPNDQLGSEIYSVWSQFRIYGNILLVIALLAVVFAEVIGGGVIDAYTLKRMLPRILVAVILINLSIYIVAALEDIANIVGGGLGSLIEAPFKASGQFKIQISGGTGNLVFGLGLATILGLVFTNGVGGILLFVFGTALLAAFGVLLTLMFRQGLLVLLILISPLAFALYCLPNAEQYFRRWWDLLFKTLLVYPIVIVVFAICNITGIVTGDLLGTTSGNAQDMLYQIMGLLSQIIPLFLIPFAFRLSGGAIGGISKGIGSVRDRLNQPLVNARKKIRESNLQNTRAGHRIAGGNEENFRGRVNKALLGASLMPKAGLRPGQMRTKMRQAIRDSSDVQADDLMAGKYASFASWSGDDAKLSAARFNSREDIERELARFDNGRFGGDRNRASREEAAAQIMQTKREVSSASLQKARIRAQAKTGTGYQYIDGNGQTQVDYARMLDDLNDAYGDDRNGAGKALSEVRTSLQQSGQMGGVAGYGTWANAMEDVYHDHSAAAHERAHNAIMDDAADSASPGVAIYGKPSSAAAFGATHLRRIQNIASSIATGADIDTGRLNQDGTHIMAPATQDDLSVAVAGAAGIYDALIQASPQNASAFANELMGQQIIPFPTAAGGVGGFGTVREYIQAQMDSNKEFVDRRRDLSRSSLEEARFAEEARRRAAEGGVVDPGATPGATPGGLPPTPRPQ